MVYLGYFPPYWRPDCTYIGITALACKVRVEIDMVARQRG